MLLHVAIPILTIRMVRTRYVAMCELVPILRRHGTGQIVVTGSVLGLRPPARGGNSVYTMSKHAVEGLVDTGARRALLLLLLVADAAPG
jgi:NAD(P)-dependent dehydrogenase (short-subunit alcohol dehydrogenase family)